MKVRAEVLLAYGQASLCIYKFSFANAQELGSRNAVWTGSQSGSKVVARFIRYSLILAGTLMAVSAVAGWVVARHAGPPGYAASLVAALVVWVGGATGLALAAVPVRPPNRVSMLLGAMLVRMGIPLATGLALSQIGGPLAEAGVFGLILVHYLIALLIEVPLTLRLVHSPPLVA